jgi:hypothetical protein
MKILMFLLLLTLPTWAKPPEASYQAAKFVSFRTVSDGESCSGHTSGNVDDSGTVAANTNTSCSANSSAEYTLIVGEQTIVVTPTMSGKKRAGSLLTLGWSTAFMKDSCLYGALPGTSIEIRSEKPGVYRVKYGKRESLYRLVGAR